MKMTSERKAFTLVELLATIAIMAVLIVAALPYVADYTSWARATSEERDAQVVAGAIARWIATGGPTTGAVAGIGSWIAPKSTFGSPFTSIHGPGIIINSLVAGWTAGGTGNVGSSGIKSPYLAPNTSITALGRRIFIAFTNASSYTVTGRSH